MKCKICNNEFGISIDMHYVSIDDDVTGISTVVRKEQVSIYDTFDCPICGCQNVVQKRKRHYIPIQSTLNVFEEEEDS